MQSFLFEIKRAVIVAFVVMYVGLFVMIFQMPDDKFHIYFLDIGQGDSVFIKTPENHQILIDGGAYSKVIEELGEVMPYFDKSIDFVMLTHPDNDHLGGLVEVLKRYKVENVVLTGVQDSSSTYIEFLKVIDEKEINIYFATADMNFYFGEVFVDVLFPTELLVGKKSQAMNNTSLVTKIIYGKDSILLTGDLESEMEKRLVSSGVNLTADILKAGHHGSKTSSTMEFLNAVSPDVVVVQCGKNNSYGHPAPTILRNFYRANVKKIYRTDEDGRIEFILPLPF